MVSHPGPSDLRARSFDVRKRVRHEARMLPDFTADRQLHLRDDLHGLLITVRVEQLGVAGFSFVAPAIEKILSHYVSGSEARGL